MLENKGSEGQKSTKMSILCSGKRELAPGREEIGIGKRKMAFEKNIAHANVPQRCVEQGLVCAMNCSNGAPGQAAASSGGEKYSGLASNLAHQGRIC